MTASGNGSYNLSDEEFLKTLADTALAEQKQTGVIEDYHLRFCKIHTPMGEELVFADTSNEASVLSSLTKTCIVTGALCWVTFFGISILLAFWMVKPVDKAWQQQRQFVADASHELKTPLTVIISNAELLQLPEYNEENKACFSERILIISRQMRGLVERLLELARADNNQTQTAFAHLNLSELTEKAVLPFEPVFFEKNLELVTDIQEGIFVEGDGQQLNQVIDILLDNAQKYAPAAGKVVLALQQKDRRHCVLSLSNACEPIEKEELNNLFKRFYRMDKARSRNDSFGLGLPIAENIVTAHHGRIRAEWRDGFITFLTELPMK